jgi:AcrR family transcriptional regulator
MTGTLSMDRRVRRTEAALWQALLALLQDHDWSGINVQMICDRADVARSTFYAHYPTKQDLLNAGFAKGADEIAAMILSKPADPARLGTLDWLVCHTAGSSGFLRRVQGSPSGQPILSRFRAMTTDFLRRDLERLGRCPDPSDIAFAAGGAFAAVEHWIAQGCREDADALVRRLSERIMAMA